MIGDIPPAFSTGINTAGLTLAARTILHAIEDIEQSHVFLLNAPPQ